MAPGPGAACAARDRPGSGPATTAADGAARRTNHRPDEPFDGEPPDDDGPVDAESQARAGGAELVFLRSGTPNVRHQPPLDPADALAWRGTVREAAERLASSVSVAQENRYCERCPVRSSCPLQPEGRQVTR